MATLEDLGRRVTALEKAVEREQTIERAVSEIVSESEQRVLAEMSGLRAEIQAETARLTAVVSASESRMVDTLNNRFDEVMTALDRPKNPPD